jgi:DNA repair protein RecO (recombination protein O)
MEWTDDAYVLAARAHGESGAIVDLLTETHGRFVAHVAGGGSRKMKPFLQPGSRVIVEYRSRVSEQLGSARLEPVGEGPSSLFDDPLALMGLSAAAAVAQGALPEREPHPGAFLAFEALTAALVHEAIWPAVFVRFEAGLLDELGFGLDLSKCAATGSTDDLVWVSPRTGRAVSREAGEPYRDKLLRLPPFLLSSQGGLFEGDVGAGLALTAHFLELFVFNPLNRPLPPARVWLVDKLGEAGRL